MLIPRGPDPSGGIPFPRFRAGALRRAGPLLVALLASAPGPAGEDGPGGGDLALVGGRIHTAAGRVIDDGTVVIRGGRIAAVGPRAETPVPPGVPTIDVTGRSIIPGLVDLWSDLPWAAAPGGRPDARADALVEPFPEAWARSLEEGITTAAIAPRPVRGVGGLGSVLKLRPARPGSVADPRLVRDSHLVLAIGLAAPGLGAASITTAERLEGYYALRSLLAVTREYGRTWAGYWEAVEKYNADASNRLAGADGGDGPGPATEDARKPEEKKADEKKAEEKKAEEKKAPDRPRPPERPARDLGKEVLLRAVDGKLPVLAVAFRAADIGYALRLREEFGLRLAVAGAAEGWRVAEDLGRAKAPVAVGPALLDRLAVEMEGHRESTGAAVAAAGAPVALCALGGDAFPSAALRLEACVLVRGGLAADLALRAATAVPAAILGIDGRVGTIEPGKDGDLVVLDGDPLDARSRVTRVIVEGRLAVSREADL
jgi:imidazolonepropionase-like amidohydrolase